MPLRALKGAPRYKRCRDIGMSDSPLACDRESVGLKRSRS
jgi:hypothetical protein